MVCYFSGFGKKNEEYKRSELSDTEDLLKEIDQARMEWDIANQYFNWVDHPDMVEYMIYYIKAAEKKYMYLLNQYKTIQETKRFHQQI